MCQGEGDSAFVGSHKLFPFSTIVFTSWDYHLTDKEAARNLRGSIRTTLKEMLNDAALAETWTDAWHEMLSALKKARRGSSPHPCPLSPCSSMHRLV